MRSHPRRPMLALLALLALVQGGLPSVMQWCHHAGDAAHIAVAGHGHADHGTHHHHGHHHQRHAGLDDHGGCDAVRFVPPASDDGHCHAHPLPEVDATVACTGDPPPLRAAVTPWLLLAPPPRHGQAALRLAARTPPPPLVPPRALRSVCLLV